MVSLVLQEARNRCGGDMTESERPVESMKNTIQKVAPRLTKDCSIGFIEISHEDRGLQSVGDAPDKIEFSSEYIRFHGLSRSSEIRHHPPS